MADEIKKDATTSEGGRMTVVLEEYVVAAIRLAIEFSADPEKTLEIIDWLVDQAPETDGSRTEGVALFVQGIRALGGSVSVPA